MQAVDDHELLAAGLARNEMDVPPRDIEFLGQQPEEGLVGGTADGWCGDPRPEDPVDHAVDMVGPRPRSQTNGEADVGVSQDSDQAPQDAQHDEDDERRQVEGAGRREGPPDGSEERLGHRDDEPAGRRPARRVDPRQEDPAEDQDPDREEQDLEEVSEERTHGPSLAAIVLRAGGGELLIRLVPRAYATS